MLTRRLVAVAIPLGLWGCPAFMSDDYLVSFDDGVTREDASSSDAPGEDGRETSRPDATTPSRDSATETGPTTDSTTETGPTADSATETGPTADSATETGPTADSATETGPATDAGLETGTTSEAGCGRTDTIVNCGSCGQACDVIHSLGAACAAQTCSYSDCAPGYADCDTTPPDSDGCETPLATTSNCGGCGQSCSERTGAASCDGTTCSYTCDTGQSDCNAASAPDTDGCECATPGCCGAGCQTVHSTGLSAPPSYFDCSPTGPSQTLAMEACTAFTGDAAACSDGTATSCSSDSGDPQAVCGAAGGSCYCWTYSGPQAGTVQNPDISSCAAACPGLNDPTWN